MHCIGSTDSSFVQLLYYTGNTDTFTEKQLNSLNTRHLDNGLFNFT